MNAHTKPHREVFDPFLGKTVQVSDDICDRLRGRYASGPTMANGEPEFGWREYPTPPIQHEAAALIADFERRLTLRDTFISEKGLWNEFATTVLPASRSEDALRTIREGENL